jgi:hypothetical protein
MEQSGRKRRQRPATPRPRKSVRGLCKSAARRRFLIQADLLRVKRAVVWSRLWSFRARGAQARRCAPGETDTSVGNPRTGGRSLGSGRMGGE